MTAETMTRKALETGCRQRVVLDVASRPRPPVAGVNLRNRVVRRPRSRLKNKVFAVLGALVGCPGLPHFAPGKRGTQPPHLPRARRLALAALLTSPPRPGCHGCLIGPEPTVSGSGITLGPGQPCPETPPGRAPCDALPSVRSRALRRAQVSERGDGGTASSRRRLFQPVPSPTSKARARQPLRDENRCRFPRTTGRAWT